MSLWFLRLRLDTFSPHSFIYTFNGAPVPPLFLLMKTHLTCLCSATLWTHTTRASLGQQVALRVVRRLIEETGGDGRHGPQGLSSLRSRSRSSSSLFHCRSFSSATQPHDLGTHFLTSWAFVSPGL